MSWSTPVSRARKRESPERSSARRRVAPAKRAPLERWMEAGLDLARAASAAALHEAVVAETLALSGADRVLLILQPGSSGNGAERGSIAAAHLPHGESASALLDAIAPWIAEARRRGAVRLRHGPDGAAPQAQRSCLVAPLSAQGEWLGCLYADIDGALRAVQGPDARSATPSE